MKLPDATLPAETLPYTCDILTDDNFALLAEYDKAIYPTDRSQMLRVFLNHPPVRQTFMAVSEDKKCVGYIGLRKMDTDRFMLCPFVADNVVIADLLLMTVAQKLKGKTVEVYMPDINSDARALFAEYGLTEPGPVETRMCTKPDAANHITVPWWKIYGVFFSNWTMY